MSLLVENINFKDTGNNSVILPNATITANNNLILTSTSGAIQIPETINMNSLFVQNCNELLGTNDADLILSSQSTQQVNFQTNLANRLSLRTTIASTTMPIVSGTGIATLANEFCNWNNFTNIQSYTPEFQAADGLSGVTYAARGGRYLQVGNLVWFTCFIRMSSFTAPTPGATARITLPVTAPNGLFVQSLTTGEYSGIDTAIDLATLSAQILGGVPRAFFVMNKKETSTSTSLVNLTFADLEQDFSIVVTGLYYLF
jgi:hypothetical protein